MDAAVGATARGAAPIATQSKPVDGAAATVSNVASAAVNTPVEAAIPSVTGSEVASKAKRKRSVDVETPTPSQAPPQPLQEDEETESEDEMAYEQVAPPASASQTHASLTETVPPTTQAQSQREKGDESEEEEEEDEEFPPAPPLPSPSAASVAPAVAAEPRAEPRPAQARQASKPTEASTVSPPAERPVNHFVDSEKDERLLGVLFSRSSLLADASVAKSNAVWEAVAKELGGRFVDGDSVRSRVLWLQTVLRLPTHREWPKLTTHMKTMLARVNAVMSGARTTPDLTKKPVEIVNKPVETVTQRSETDTQAAAAKRRKTGLDEQTYLRIEREKLLQKQLQQQPPPPPMAPPPRPPVEVQSRPTKAAPAPKPTMENDDLLLPGLPKQHGKSVLNVALEEKIMAIVLKHAPMFPMAAQRNDVWEAIARDSRGRYESGASAKSHYVWLTQTVLADPNHREYSKITPKLRKMCAKVQKFAAKRSRQKPKAPVQAPPSPATQPGPPTALIPLPTAQQTTPATQQSTPVTQQPIGVTQQPTGVTQQPTPVTQQSTSAMQQSTPATQQPTQATQQAPPAVGSLLPLPELQAPMSIAAKKFPAARLAKNESTSTVNAEFDTVLMEQFLLKRPFDYDRYSKPAVWREIAAAAPDPRVVSGVYGQKRISWLLDVLKNPADKEHAKLTPKLRELLHQYADMLASGEAASKRLLGLPRKREIVALIGVNPPAPRLLAPAPVNPAAAPGPAQPENIAALRPRRQNTKRVFDEYVTMEGSSDEEKDDLAPEDDQDDDVAMLDGDVTETNPYINELLIREILRVRPFHKKRGEGMHLWDLVKNAVARQIGSSYIFPTAERCWMHMRKLLSVVRNPKGGARVAVPDAQMDMLHLLDTVIKTKWPLTVHRLKNEHHALLHRIDDVLQSPFTSPPLQPDGDGRFEETASSESQPFAGSEDAEPEDFTEELWRDEAQPADDEDDDDEMTTAPVQLTPQQVDEMRVLGPELLQLLQPGLDVTRVAQDTRATTSAAVAETVDLRTMSLEEQAKSCVRQLEVQSTTIEQERAKHRSEVLTLVEMLKEDRARHKRETDALLAVIKQEREDRKSEFVAMMNLITRSVLPAEPPSH